MMFGVSTYPGSNIGGSRTWAGPVFTSETTKPRKRSMGSHQSQNSETTTWLTPPEIVEALGPFDLDPCAAPSPRPWPTAKRMIELPEDGMAAEWHGRVWLNPPYGRVETFRWLDKLADHGDGIALIFARTETEGFVRTVWKRATAVLFLYKRLHFHFPDGTRSKPNSGAPSVLVAYGDEAAERLRTCGLNGAFARLRTSADAGSSGNPDKDLSSGNPDKEES